MARTKPVCSKCMGICLIQGLTTNPTLMKKAGITDYRAFCKDILTYVKTKPISFEVFSDDFDEMERQALEIAKPGPKCLRQNSNLEHEG